MVALDSDTACRGAAKEKAGRYCAFSVRAIRLADNLNFLQINSQRPFSFGCFSEWAPGPSPSVQNQQL